jgi:hypothetical protein
MTKVLCYYNNGHSVKEVEHETYVPDYANEIIFDHEAAEYELHAAFPNYGTVTPEIPTDFVEEHHGEE